MTNIIELKAEWSRDEEISAAHLYERGVSAVEVADAINERYKNGRTTVAVRRRMHKLGVIWGKRSDDNVDIAARRYLVTRGARLRLETMYGANRPQPWHPLNDPKPQWLQR